MKVHQGRPQILFLAHRIPHPPNRGDRIRSFHMVRFLAERADVHLAFLTDAPAPPASLAVLGGLCRRVAAAPLGRRARWFHAARSGAAGRTATEGLFRSARLDKIVRGWSRETRFDAVVVFCSSMMQYAGPALQTGARLLVDLVDVDSQKWFDYAETSRGLKRFFFALEGRRLRRLESSLPRQADAVTVVSRQEADLYRGFCPSDRIFTISNGVDLDYFQPREAPAAIAPPRCVFVGALDYRANVDGVQWFAERVWPVVHRERPDARFQLVGSHPARAVRRLAELPGVELIGAVDDVRPWLAAAALVVVPLRVARGIQNKVLEGLAMGRAVVATPQAIEGLAVQPELHLSRAHAPEEWIETVCGLLGDRERRERLGCAGRAYVESHHRWDDQLSAIVRLPGLSELSWTGPDRVEAPPRPSAGGGAVLAREPGTSGVNR
ncbi:MAG: TIGR03087 family PEP-CTERM/XrtA system glycosyltransferase [Pirellulales bacterium]|nr:TIGR03087 family PEP-CTERM/XrtA system glycosyltransferase [Pirellulales bacterium]